MTNRCTASQILCLFKPLMMSSFTKGPGHNILVHAIVHQHMKTFIYTGMTDKKRERERGRETVRSDEQRAERDKGIEREQRERRDDRKEVKIIIPPPLPFPPEVTGTVIYNPGSGKLIR